jgi:hypothetical protein
LVNFNCAYIFSFDIEIILVDSGRLLECDGFISWALAGIVICNRLEVASHLWISFLGLLNHKVYLIFITGVQSESIIHYFFYFLVVLLFFILISHCNNFFLILLNIPWHFLLVSHLRIIFARSFYYYWMIIVVLAIVS